MLKLGIPELALILVIALLIFGPTKLPKLGKALGQTINNFRRSSTAAPEAGGKGADSGEV